MQNYFIFIKQITAFYMFNLKFQFNCIHKNIQENEGLWSFFKVIMIRTKLSWKLVGWDQKYREVLGKTRDFQFHEIFGGFSLSKWGKF